MLRDIKEGRQRFDKVRELCKLDKTSTDRATDAAREAAGGSTPNAAQNGHYHLGVCRLWMQGGQDSCEEEDSDHEDNDESEEESNTNTIAARSRGTNGKQYILEPAFRESLDKRANHFDWLTGELPVAEDLCHPLYSTCSPFVGFSANLHFDKDDASPTVLLNFGYARLDLPEYNAVVDLHPAQVAFFNSMKVKHFTAPHPGYEGSVKDRWAIIKDEKAHLTFQRKHACPATTEAGDSKQLEAKKRKQTGEENTVAEEPSGRKKRARPT
ncbi:uncharacterized protein UTRI_02535 [Ustilago trichophora]|uniref:Uncharacterized protein n=1 Tax=Ustilago trichophora TaxID=86804 RepID=A0A5C3EAN4_9BASI|nr:uncharacterized protein UTRI_02535 [Ustilago trichophora]